jgi:hypothetical protein
VRFPYQGRYSTATRPDTLVMTATTTMMTTSTGSKTGHLQDQVQFGCFVLHLVAFQASLGFLSGEGFPLGCPWAPPGPSFGPGCLWPLCGAEGGLLFLAWSWFPPSSADFGPGNHSTSIFQVYPFAVIQWGLLHLLVESAPAPVVAGWTTVNVNVAMHLLEMRPIQVCPERWVADSLRSSAPPPSFYRSVALLQGVPLR